MKAALLLRAICILGLTFLMGCAPQALYFHESTRVSFSAAYTASDSQPLSTSFGYKRRIVAIVPGQDRISTTGQEAAAENKGEALSTISKFYVKAGTKDGLVIKNNFATGMAARKLMQEPTSAAVAVAGLMHGPTGVPDSTGAVLNAAGDAAIGSSGTPLTVSDVAAARVARIKSKMIGGGKPRPQNLDLEQKPARELFIRDGVTWERLTFPDGRVVETPLRKKSGGPKKDTDPAGKPDALPAPTNPVDAVPAAELFPDPVTGKTMRRIKKTDGTFEVVPLR